MNLLQIVKKPFQYANTARKFTGYNLLKHRTPVSVGFIITHRCNFRCTYCDSPNQVEEEMTTEQIFAMVDELAAIGLERLGITGGEPTLRMDIGEIIDYAKSKGIVVTMVTNGSLLNEKRLDEIKNLNLLLMSFDGPPEIHNTTRVRASYDRLMETIKLVRSKGIPLWTETVLTKFNLNQIDFILDKADELDFKCLFQPVFNYPLARNKETINSITPPTEEFKKAMDNLIAAKKAGRRVVGSVSYFEFLKDKYPISEKYGCKAGEISAAITPSGQVVPCHFVIKDGRKWPNGVQIGFREAFSQIADKACIGCFCNAYWELNFISSFKPEAVMNALQNRI
ncbi:radical SAM protein [Candidatus Woesearchaeota archaeon]|nr:radical SAM protein [Candidatus Woesearchaeota archaeon]